MRQEPSPLSRQQCLNCLSSGIAVPKNIVFGKWEKGPWKINFCYCRINIYSCHSGNMLSSGNSKNVPYHPSGPNGLNLCSLCCQLGIICFARTFYGQKILQMAINSFFVFQKRKSFEIFCFPLVIVL